MCEVKQQQAQQNGVELPPIYTMPINKQAVFFIISGAFPTLFPTNKTDFNFPPNCLVNFTAFAKHIFKYKDSWFKRHF